MDATKLDRYISTLKKHVEKNVTNFVYLEDNFPAFFSENGYTKEHYNKNHTLFKRLFFSIVNNKYPNFYSYFNNLVEKISLSCTGSVSFSSLGIDYGSSYNYNHNLTQNFIEYKISDFFEVTSTSKKYYDNITDYIREDNINAFCIKIIVDVFESSKMYLNYKGVFCINKYFLSKFMLNHSKMKMVETEDFYLNNFLRYNKNPEKEFLSSDEKTEIEMVKNLRKIGNKYGWEIGSKIKYPHLKILENWNELEYLDSRLFLFDLDEKSYSLLKEFDVFLNFKTIVVKTYLLMSIFEKWNNVNEALQLVLAEMD